MITVAIGSAIGLFIGNRISERIQESVMTGLGLVTLFVGISNANATGNIIIPLLSLVFGVIIGELLDIDGALQRFAGWLQERFGAVDRSGGDAAERRARFITGFVTASLIFCVGPLTVIGSIQDGMGIPGGYQQLAIKSVLDAFAAMALASSLGVGVAFTIITVFVIQGGLAVGGSLLGEFMSAPMTAEMTAVGGLILIGLALILLDVKRPRVANFLPALVLAPVFVAVATAIGLNIYPF
ncbi:MAG: DUF554 domain-containing protein [Anaerolineae bacterium]|nr:DUF554 domain-containing protein [Anaerolineae bacterium]